MSENASDKDHSNLSKGLKRFQLEDPTFYVDFSEESREIIISGMGELHLDIYLQRLQREFNCNVTKQDPTVAYRESIASPVKFNYLHKKQTGGAGQYAAVQGRLIPLTGEDNQKVEFVDRTVGNNIPRNFIPSIEKGWVDAVKQGVYLKRKIAGLKMVLEDGKSHIVDSSDHAFRTAARSAVQTALREVAEPRILEPIMLVEITAPDEFQGKIQGTISKKRAIVTSTDVAGGYYILRCEIPLKEMFGYSTALRSQTQGKGEFSMEFKRYDALPQQLQEEMIAEFQAENTGKK